MTVPGWQSVPLSRRHDRKAFDCGVPDLDTYLTRYARWSRMSEVHKLSERRARRLADTHWRCVACRAPASAWACVAPWPESKS